MLIIFLGREVHGNIYGILVTWEALNQSTEVMGQSFWFKDGQIVEKHVNISNLEIKICSDRQRVL